ncbi:hypothetical protein [Amycolatopsis taiwanensis]|uniref:hypothetical protein n=1 Tax=Amycolatopsis taiwanensis TaxID=342230 RepID=UPI0004802507|nr:hypothetical protein [Amycolatopsis taiwanensis]
MVRTINGVKVPVGDDKPSGGRGAKTLVAAVVVVCVVAAGGVGVSGGFGLGAGGTGAAGDVLAGNSAGDVTDALAGRDPATRKAEGRKSAQHGKTGETWSKLGLKELRKAVRQEVKQFRCEAAATGEVRDFLLRTPCTSLRRVIWALGDGHGNAVVVSVVWVGFRTRAQAEDFERVERVQGSGDIEPLGAPLLGLSHISFTGLHYGSHRERTIMAVAEAETATGHFDNATLDAIAEVSAWLPHP